MSNKKQFVVRTAAEAEAEEATRSTKGPRAWIRKLTMRGPVGETRTVTSAPSRAGTPPKVATPPAGRTTLPPPDQRGPSPASIRSPAIEALPDPPANAVPVQVAKPTASSPPSKPTADSDNARDAARVGRTAAGRSAADNPGNSPGGPSDLNASAKPARPYKNKSGETLIELIARADQAAIEE